MVVVQDRSLRKASGGRNTGTRPRRLAQSGSNPSLTGIGNKRARTKRTRGGSTKTSLLSTDTVNLYDPSTGKHIKAKIKEVTENPSNRNYIRRNIITKGAVIDTDKGLAVVTNRPGQDGQINVVLKK